MEYTPEEIRQIFDEYQRVRALGEPVTADLARRVKDASVGIKNYSDSLSASLASLKNASLGLGTSLKDGKEGASVYNDTLRSGAEMLSTLLTLLGPLGKLFGLAVEAFTEVVIATNEQSDALFDGYNKLTRFGAGLETGMDGVYKLSQQLGYSTKDLNSMVSMLDESRTIFPMFGGTTSRGLTAYGGLVDSLRAYETEFRALGLSSEDVNASVQNYLRITTLTGRSQIMREGQLTKGALKYIFEQQLVSRLTGQNAQLQKEADAEMANNNVFQVSQRELRQQQQKALASGDKATADKLEAQFNERIRLIRLMPQSMRKGAMDLMAGYVSASDEAEQFLRMAPEAAAQIRGGQFNAIAVLDTASKEARVNLDRYSGSLGKLGMFADMFGDYAGVRDLDLMTSKATMAVREEQAKTELKTRKDVNDATRAYSAQLVEQRRFREAAEDVINLGVGPATFAMRKLTDAAKAVSTLGAGAATAVTGVGGASPAERSNLPTMLRGAGAQSGTTPGTGGTPDSGRRGSLTALLTLIGNVEANGNYNILVGGQTDPNLTNMSIGEVLKFQGGMRARGHESTAVGKYQIIQTTLQHLVNSGEVSLSDKFSPATQDKLALALLNRRGYQRFLQGAMDVNQFADMIAMEWASFPTASGKSYYAGIGSNRTLVDRSQVVSTLQGYRFGGVSQGPESGYMVELHGDEAVVPLPDGRSIPVEMPNYIQGMRSQLEALSEQNSRLDSLIAIMKNRNTLSEKIMRAYQT